MPNKGPFAGMALSQQVAPPKIEQRLFEPTGAPVRPAAEPRHERARPTSTPAPERKPTAHHAAKSLAKATPHFDLADEPLYKATFIFTQQELEALEDLKLEFRRDLDTKVTKYDLVRAAVHMLVEDHASNGQRSYISRKLKSH